MTGSWQSWRDALRRRLATIPDADTARHRAGLVLVDDLAAAVHAADHDEVRRFAGQMVNPGAPEATIIAGGSAPRERAAAANAVATAFDELDEGYRPATCHGGLYALPAAMAEAEATGRSTGELLDAVVAGYEVAAQIARILPAPRPLRLHPHATLSPVGAAAAVSWLRTQDPDAVLRAADVAASMSMTGPFSHAVHGRQARNVWAGAGATVGFLAVAAADSGLTADQDTILEVFRAQGHQFDEDAVARLAGEGWAIESGYHKRYAACQYTHAALECALDLVDSGVRGDQIERIDVATHPLALALDQRSPSTPLGGKFSLPHVVAATLVAGNADAATYGVDGLDDPAVATLRELVEIRPYGEVPAPPHDRPARLTVRTRDGREHRSECLSAVGGPDRPLGEGEVLAKVADLTRDTAPGFADAARRLVDGGAALTAPWPQTLADLLGTRSTR